jgi:4-amino-4-deoxy-L-arabinose transferase-like glycosyltransferase
MSSEASRAPSPWTGRALLLLSGLAIVAIYLLGIDGPLSNYDEPIYAEFIRAMHDRGDIFSLRYQGAETLQRPPVSVALYAGVAALSDSEWGLRLGPALVSALVALLAGGFAARTTGSRWTALIAAALTAGAPTFFLYGRLLLSDPPFVLACLCALIATIEAQTNPRAMRWIAISLGLGFLLKSMAGAVPMLVLAPWWLLAAKRHHKVSHATTRRIATDVAIFIVLASAYYIFGLIIHGQSFWDEHIGAMLIDRASGDLGPFIGIGGPDAYLRHMGSHDGLLYCGLALLSVGGACVVAWRERNAAIGVLVTYAIGSLLLLSLISTRLPHYLLAIYPAIGLCAAICAHRIAKVAGEQAQMATVLACVVAVAVFGQGISSAPTDAATLPDPASKTLGLAAAKLPGNTRVYSLDWYTPAFGYYAARPWTMLHSNPDVAAGLASMDPFAQAKNVQAVPPWPTGRFVVAAHESSLVSARLTVIEVLAAVEGYVLVVATP